MVYKTKQEIQNEQYLTYDQLNIIIAVQKFWFKHAIWTREYIRASIYNTPNLKSATNFLINLPSEIYSIFSIFYGTEVAQNIANLILDFTKATMGVTEVMKYGDRVLTDSRIIEWYQVADKTSSALAKINIYWDENQWKYLLYQYIKIRTDDINAVINDDYEAQMELYKKLENINFLLSSYLARGIISSNLQPTPNQ